MLIYYLPEPSNSSASASRITFYFKNFAPNFDCVANIYRFLKKPLFKLNKSNGSNRWRKQAKAT